MPKKLTQKEVTQRFHDRWGDRYCYSKVKYVNRRTKVIITCHKHGDFLILPLEHANGCGCPKCGNESQAIKISKPKYDKSELLKKLHNVHGYNKFDYSLIEDEKFVYNGVKTKIPVKCNACGTIFYPLASEHLSGKGCNVCRLKQFSKAYLGKYKQVDERELVSNVGIIDANWCVTNDKPFSVWREMIVRCYKESSFSKRPTYKECEVCEEWKHYSNYKKWYEDNYVKGFDVDKDLLSFYIGKKIYSPLTCCFLPKEINNALSSTKSKKRDLPTGVYIIGGSIIASCGKNHKDGYLGSFSTIDDAHKAYLKAKKEHITQLANKWKDKIEQRAYEALIKLDVNIFFNNNK